MGKFFLPLLLIIFLMIGCGGTQQNSDNLNSTKNEKPLVIGLDDEYAPFGFHNEKGELIGLDIDLAKEAAKRMGVKFEFTSIDWSKKEDELYSGNIDIIWNGFDITPERKEKFLYSKPYMDNRQILLVKLGNESDFHSIYDLEGKIVGTQAGSTAETCINGDENLKNSLAKFGTYRNFRRI